MQILATWKSIDFLIHENKLYKQNKLCECAVDLFSKIFLLFMGDKLFGITLNILLSLQYTYTLFGDIYLALV